MTTRPSPLPRHSAGRPTRIAIDARVHDGEYIGVQQTMRGLADGLSVLDEGSEEYHFLVWSDHEWLRPSLRGRCRPLVVPPPRRGRVESSALARRAPQVAKSIAHLWEGRGHLLPSEDAALGAAGIELVHFMQQRGFRTRLPNIYQPHDLQHEHLPDLFHPLQRAYRRASYRAMARQADRVGVMTSAGRRDAVTHLGVDPEAVIVVPWGSVMTRADDPGGGPPEGTPARYLLYPAQSWPHKNHAGLVRALAVLRARSLDVHVVCTGPRSASWEAVMEAARSAGVADLLVDLGFVPDDQLRVLYGGADALVFPSRYEGWGLPVVEAFALGVPVLCSDISPLREVTGGAASLFDPDDAQDMAERIAEVWTDPLRREQLAGAAAARGEAFTWERTAELFRAHYRDVLGRPLGERDRELLAAPDLV